MLAVVALCFTVLIAWGFFGSLVSSVSGPGVLLLSGGARPVLAQASGTVTQLNVIMGAPVRRGQVIGQLHNAEMIFQMRKLELDYAQLCRESEALTAGSEEMTKLRLSLERQREAALSSLTEKYDHSFSRSKKLTQSYQTLKDMGAVSMADYFSTLDNMLNTEAQLLSNHIQVMLSSAQMRELDWEQRQNLISLENRRMLKSLELELARKLFREAFWLAADLDGHILELFKSEGDFVRQGDSVALVSSDESLGFYLAGFLPVDSGKKISAGMSVYFAPASVRPDEYGYILGVVREVSAAPISPLAVEAETHNPSLAETICGGGAVIRVVVELLPDEATVSGLRWTSRAGAPLQLSNGMLGTLSINTEYRRPASYVIPYARAVIFGD